MAEIKYSPTAQQSYGGMKSVQSSNLCKSLPTGQAGVIQTSYDIVKAHGGEMRLQTTKEKGQPAGLTGAELILKIPIL